VTVVLYAEFRAEGDLRKALASVAPRADLEIDLFTPYPVADLEPLLRVRRSYIPLLVLTAGVSGAIGAYLLQLWCAAISYPVDVGGRPLHSAPAFIPITFESAVLAACTTAFVAILVAARLGRLYDPLFDVDGFERAMTDRFWMSVTGPGAATLADVREALSGAGALRVVEREAR
jgi:hypothetical protein